MADKQVCFSAPDEPPLGRILVLTLLKKNKNEALNKRNTPVPDWFLHTKTTLISTLCRPPRSCTDVVCCVIFIIVILGYVALGTVGECEPLQPITSHGPAKESSAISGCNCVLRARVFRSSCLCQIVRSNNLSLVES